MLRRPIPIRNCRSGQERRGQNHQNHGILRPRQVAFHIDEVNFRPKQSCCHTSRVMLTLLVGSQTAKSRCSNAFTFLFFRTSDLIDLQRKFPLADFWACSSSSFQGCAVCHVIYQITSKEFIPFLPPWISLPFLANFVRN